MNDRKKLMVATAGLLAQSGTLFAHPGHGLFEQGVGHAVTSPVHLLVLGLIAVGFFVAAQFVRRVTVRQGLRAAGALSACGAIALWTFGS